MIVTTSDSVPGREVVESLGIARGNVVRAKHIGTDFLASLKNLVGGEVHGYSQLMAGAREQAYDRMVHAGNLAGADAIICMRFSTSMIMQGSAEILAYGTAVKLSDPE